MTLSAILLWWWGIIALHLTSDNKFAPERVQTLT
jgi:hypothetical protein